jgi:hypothetical protein
VRLHFDPRLPRPQSLALVFTAILVFMARGAAAADQLGVEARVGFGFGEMLSKWQQEQGYQLGYVPELRPGLRLGSSTATELTFASWFFPRADSGTGRATLFGAGLRWDPRLRTWLTWFLDGHGGLALTGPANRFMFDAATGFDVWVADNLAFGLFLRYGQIVGHGADPVFWAGGLGVTMTFASAKNDKASGVPQEDRQRAWELARERERQTPEDRDHDGVADLMDACPDQPAGPRPDENKPGCPRGERRLAKRVEARPVERDRDGDGVPDREDRCPDKPFGQNPDPFAPGCPLPDSDHDGIPDVLDACPKKSGKPSPNARRNGCGPGGALLPVRPTPCRSSEGSA